MNIKLIFLKLSSLLLLIAGIVLVGQFVSCPYVCSYIAKVSDGSLDVLFPGSFRLATGIVLILIGGYSFLPSLPPKKPAIRVIKQNLENGISEINLTTLEKECEAMLKKVAPLKQVSVFLTPSKDQKKVCVEINPVVILTENQNLPDIQEMLIHRIEEFINTYFGLSIATPVVIKLNNIQLEGDKIYSSLGKSAFDLSSPSFDISPKLEEKEESVTAPCPTETPKTEEISSENISSMNSEINVTEPEDIMDEPEMETLPPLGEIQGTEKKDDTNTSLQNDKSYLSDLMKQIEEPNKNDEQPPNL
ncbi:MAG TPA: hypothetical protein PLX23_01490 [Candidatus Hydrogenedens sp.]|nr:hypothetical protein [Candidatus Hydrogenedens sp.]